MRRYKVYLACLSCMEVLLLAKGEAVDAINSVRRLLSFRTGSFPVATRENGSLSEKFLKSARNYKCSFELFQTFT